MVREKDGDAVDRPRRRPSFWVGEGGNALGMEFQNHTLKVLGEEGMEGRKRRWEEEREAMDANEQGLHGWPENTWSAGYPRWISVSADCRVAPASQPSLAQGISPRTKHEGRPNEQINLDSRGGGEKTYKIILGVSKR